MTAGANQVRGQGCLGARLARSRLAGHTWREGSIPGPGRPSDLHAGVHEPAPLLPAEASSCVEFSFEGVHCVHSVHSVGCAECGADADTSQIVECT